MLHAIVINIVVMHDSQWVERQNEIQVVPGSNLVNYQTQVDSASRLVLISVALFEIDHIHVSINIKRTLA
jgi:hypothetical protein